MNSRGKTSSALLRALCGSFGCHEGTAKDAKDAKRGTARLEEDGLSLLTRQARRLKYAVAGK